MGVVMSGKGVPALLRNDIVRLLIVAVLGAGAVILIQSLTKGGHATKQAATAQAGGSQATGAGSGAAASGSRPAGSAATGKAAAKPGSTPAAAGAATIPTTPKGLARLSVTGRGLSVVVDQPSGPFAQQNRLILQGATVAVDQLNAAGGIGGHRIKLVQERLDRLSPAAVQARLRAAGSTTALVLPCDTNSQVSLAAGAAQYKTLMLAPCNPDPGTAQRISSYWPVGMAANDEAAGLAGFLRTVGYSCVYVVSAPGSRYIDNLTRYFSAAAPLKNVRLAGQSTVPLSLSAAALSQLARSIKAASPAPSAIFTALYPPYVNRLAAGLRRRGVRQIVVGTAAMDIPLTLSSGSAVLDNAIFTSYGFVRQNNAASRFVSDYRRRYGQPVGSFPGLGFETIRLLEGGVAKARSTDATAIQQALAGGIALSGVGLADRSYKNGADHNPVGTVSVVKVFSGNIEPLFAGTPSGSPKA
jgi:branched-chain amino acid transport system substrate-binding protein